MSETSSITIHPDGSATTGSSKTTLVIHPGGGTTSSAVTTSGSMSSSFSSSSTSQSSKSVTGSSTTTKTVKQTTSSSKTVKTSSSVMKSSSVKTSSSSSKAISVKSNTSSFSDTFGKQFGIDVDAEMKKLMAGADQEVQAIREKFFNLTPLALTSGTGSDIIKLDNTSINNYIDKANNDRLKFNFDVTEFESESINVKSDGNKIEVHAIKKSKKGDAETNEEYSRTYELPTSGTLDSDKVTSSFFKDGVLTIELPVADATKTD